MTIDAQLLTREVAAAATGAAPLATTLKSLPERLGTWLQRCADHWSDAALYDQLNGLSDAELSRLGMSRDVLARDTLGAGARDRGA